MTEVFPTRPQIHGIDKWSIGFFRLANELVIVIDPQSYHQLYICRLTNCTGSSIRILLYVLQTDSIFCTSGYYYYYKFLAKTRNSQLEQFLFTFFLPSLKYFTDQRTLYRTVELFTIGAVCSYWCKRQPHEETFTVRFEL